MSYNLRHLAIVDDYTGLLESLRSRADELDVSRVTLDGQMGLAPGYAAKLLCGMKNLGAKSTGPMLKSMGLVLIVAEDVEATARLRAALPKRQYQQNNKEAAE